MVKAKSIAGVEQLNPSSWLHKIKESRTLKMTIWKKKQAIMYTKLICFVVWQIVSMHKRYKFNEAQCKHWAISVFQFSK